MATFRLAPYCLGCLPALHAPLYAAAAIGAFDEAGVPVELLDQVPRDTRIARLGDGTVDLALIDLASFVDAHVDDAVPGARCMFVLTQRLPMAAHVLRAPGRAPIETGEDLVDAPYGGTADSAFVAEHRALLRRLDSDRPELRVDVRYSDLFGALAAGRIDVAPDFGGVGPRFARAAAPAQVDAVRYRDCGISAYGIGFVASCQGLERHPTRMAIVCEVLAEAYRRMRTEPEQVVDDARRLLPDLDRDHALSEWRDEEAPVIFGFDAADFGPGAQNLDGWVATAGWRAEVRGQRSNPTPEQLFSAP